MKSIIIATFILTLVAGCSTGIAKKDAFPGMYPNTINSILVLPAVNQSSAADAPDLYSSTILEPLSNAGYYVLPIEITDKILKNEGISDGEQLANVPAQKFGQMFNADAVLFVEIDEWKTSYMIVSGSVSVGIKYKLVSTKTNKTLWKYRAKQVVDTGGDSNNGGGILGAIISTAINTATQDYVPIARKVNLIALNSIPFGKYHIKYDKDKEQKVIEYKD
ncbi:MAG: DUF799 domain-containing protein [Chromatiales bacterium]|nr:DUF799 domain-containing protein [Chromatiales bacterium]